MRFLNTSLELVLKMGSAPGNGHLVSQSMEGKQRGTVVTLVTGSVVKLVIQLRSMAVAI